MLTVANISNTFKHYIKLIHRTNGNIRVTRASTNLAFSVKSSANSICCTIIEKCYYDVIIITEDVMSKQSQ